MLRTCARADSLYGTSSKNISSVQHVMRGSSYTLFRSSMGKSRNRNDFAAAFFFLRERTAIFEVAGGGIIAVASSNLEATQLKTVNSLSYVDLCRV